MDMPARLGLRLEDEGLRAVAGEDADGLCAEAATLIFEHPVRDLPRMDDPELQKLLVAGFWRALTQRLVTRGMLRPEEHADGYLVSPHVFPSPLLNSLRESCSGERPLQLVGIAHEAAALVLGFLRSEACHLKDSAPAAVTICLVIAIDDRTVDVACFDYEQTTPTSQRILIRDFFQTTCAELSARLHDCDWLGAFSQLVVIEDPTLAPQAQTAINAPLQAIAEGIAIERQQSSVAWQLKLSGGAHIALCASGRAPDEQEYDIGHACHIGLQIDQRSFQPVIDKEAWTHLTEFPHFAAQAFRLRGQTGNALRLNLYSGYSTRIAVAVPLGHTMLSHEDLAQLNGAGSFTAALRFDTPCTGEFLLGLMPENRALRRQPFRLPGLMG
jgi:hypothetical protein